MNKTKPIELRLFDSLREYCEKRWKIQDTYVDACFKILRRYINILFLVLLGTMFILNVILAVEVSHLEQRVQTIEQTWSE